MPEPTLLERQVELLQRLEQLVRERTAATEAAERAAKVRQVETATAAEENARQIQANAATRQQKSERDYRAAVERLHTDFQGAYGPTERDYQALKQKLEARYNAEKAAAKKKLDERSWETQTVYDATRHKPKREFVETERQVNARVERLQAIAGEAQQFLADCRLLGEPQVDSEGTPPIAGEDPLKSFIDLLARAEELLAELQRVGLAKFFRGMTPLWVVIGLWALAVYPTGVLTDWQLIWVPISLGIAVLVGITVILVLFKLAATQVHRVYDPLGQTLVDAERARARWFEAANARWQRETAEIKARHEAEVKRATDAYNALKETAKKRREDDRQAIEARFPPRLAELKARYEEQLRTLESNRQQDRAVQARDYEQAVAAEKQRAAQALVDQRQADEADWQNLVDRWHSGLAEVEQEAAALSAACDQQFLDWDDPRWDAWQPPTSVARAVRFGTLDVRLDQFTGTGAEDAPPEDQRLRPRGASVYRLPALVDFPLKASLILRAANAGRARAVEALQAIMLRYMSAIPAGKLRFTIIDPVGLGQNFAGFMHLADYEELLVTHKIWTEPQQIEQRLADMTSHMANVIQKYLRNEYETIEQYNEQAGEVAEPFRVLVIANFPFGFSDAAIRHLMSVISTGARCGVHTLISVDTKLPLPHGFRLVDLEAHAARLIWRDDMFVWKDPTFERFPLTIDTAPSNERFSQIVHLVGNAAKNANRVEVPFEFIAPEPGQYWTGDSARGVEVALGRAGATKRQYMRLGRGTAQHALIAGKTGSGKSTLLHALITNLALNYSPDEVQLYLIDFKKGVEFKTYAQFQLPHARVIAIESEREFGLSVLQRLDAELKYRGDLFRDLNVADLGGYRAAGGAAILPRILLIVDEFQEFFVEDDKIAQDVSLLLDRLVRQGRAFGIHLQLGSQTLGGAYSLARSTLGQFAIRVALQCSEADANLILSEENSAAKLLTRPGEAIYNDANGRSEGNNLFQVVWLSDDRHEHYLRAIHELARERNIRAPEQIIFEGNIPAEVAKNQLLAAALGQEGSALLAAQAWLGDAIAIKDPTAVLFRRQSGSHLLMIGQQSEAALAMLSIMTVSLAAQQPTARIFVLDGQPPDSATAAVLPRVGRAVPQIAEVAGPRDTARIVGHLDAELERRRTANEAEAPAIYLMIYDLQRFRDLRKGEDDFGFSRGAEKPNPSKQLISLLREGSAFGIHVVIWCDTYNNVQRSFDRQTMREFENRVLFQMSVADSSTLIDSPMASKLGAHRALLHSEEQGRLEKFRPYKQPDDDWLRAVNERLVARRASLPATATSVAEDVVAESGAEPLSTSVAHDDAVRGSL